MDFDEQIQTIIDSAVEEKTFSLDAIEKIKELKKEFEKIKEDNEKLTEQLKDNTELLKEANATITEQLTEIETANTTIADWVKREEDLIQRENKMSLNEANMNNQYNRGNELVELFKIVCANPVLVKTKHSNKQISIESSPGYSCVSSYPEDETITEEIQ